MGKLAREPYIEYQRALDGFTKVRKEMNDFIASEDFDSARKVLDTVKGYAAAGDAIAMDLLAYFYKSGVKGIIPENYMRYIQWEFLAASYGNELAIEKLQFLTGYACDAIMDNERYDLMEYKNDIDEYNALYVIGKNISKVVVKHFMKIFPIDLVQLEDDEKLYKKEDFINLRKIIDDAIPKTIELMCS